MEDGYYHITGLVAMLLPDGSTDEIFEITTDVLNVVRADGYTALTTRLKEACTLTSEELNYVFNIIANVINSRSNL